MVSLTDAVKYHGGRNKNKWAIHEVSGLERLYRSQ
jgi:hypothetical protein